MKKPVIGITCAVQQAGEYKGKMTLNSAYTRAIAMAGGVPVAFPAEAYSPSLAENWVGILDGLLLPGGGDVDPSLFGEDAVPELGSVNRPLDDLELPITRMAAEKGIPILGICRGIQTINVAFGGTLYQDIPSQHPSDVHHHQDAGRHEPTHDITVVPGTGFAKLFPQQTLKVNSFHHQAVKVTAPGFTVSAYAPDGIVEAMEDSARGIYGVQFHPEELFEYVPGFDAIFQAFIRRAQNG